MPYSTAYDQQGQLIGEYNATNKVISETVYLGTTPVALIKQMIAGTTTIPNYIYAYQIDTPRVITRASDNKMQWRWDQADSFGLAPANENPQAQGAFTSNARFPGQLYDKETNLHYNWHRDYDPQLGRYFQSVPIGLAGGINTFAYVTGNPLNLNDPLGLWGWAGQIGLGGNVGAAVGPGIGGFLGGSGAIQLSVDSGGVSLSGQITGSFTTGVGAYISGGVQYGTGPTFGNNLVNVGVQAAGAAGPVGGSIQVGTDGATGQVGGRIGFGVGAFGRVGGYVSANTELFRLNWPWNKPKPNDGGVCRR